MDSLDPSASDKRYRALMAKAHEGIVLYNNLGVIIYASASVRNVGGFEDREVIGMSGTDFVHPDEIEETIMIFGQVLQTPGKSITFKQRLKHKKGHFIWTETTLSNFLHEPEVGGIISNFRDITDQKYAEDKLLESKTLLESINQNIKEAIYRSIPDQSFEYVNQAFLDIFGFESKEELNAVPLSSLYIDPVIRNHIRDELHSKGSITNMEVEFRKKDNSTFWGLITSTKLETPDGHTYFDGAIRDITQQKIAEEKLRHSEEFLSSINRNIKEGLYRSSIDTGMIYVNSAFAEMFGYSSPKEVLETDIKELYRHLNTRRNIIKELTEKKSIRNKEVEFKRKNGETFWGLMSSYLIVDSQGNEYFDGAVRNINELKIAEQKLVELNETLTQQNKALAEREEELNKAMKELSDRNFELDQLVYKTSHDLRSPLSSILGLVNVAKMDTETTDKSEYIEQIGFSIHRLDDFVRSMLNYAKASRVDVTLEEIDIKEIIDSCLKDLAFLETYNKVKTNISIKGNSSIKTDKLKLKIILSNIISNAFKYMDDSKPEPYLNIDIITSTKELKITISDNGIGIEEEHLPKIFDMFYRATELSQGSGLGMYIVKQSVDKLEGTVTISSKFKEGTTFNISLPNGTNS
ncbi:PAS domain-containing sensor histidine kinase [Fulvivirga lutimaris]|uniref:PAS domain-containing sensor histidine kinase n=1 Tax=Fulvivirga lutimaris TaxID=1819566 RepID=UPI0012BD6A10|nr:PAS domain-containing sensor histidine kinase [Fulvivirga lutimaris]MTI40705.1 PAS domain-containing sensor histidine kinase [Fulvivirga lutimaris]